MAQRLDQHRRVQTQRTPLLWGVAGIAKFFDQVRKGIVYKMVVAVGMPPMVLRAYKVYIENLLLYNCLAGGVGRPH